MSTSARRVKVRQTAPVRLVAASDGEAYVRTSTGATWRVVEAATAGVGVVLELEAVDPHHIPLDAEVVELMRSPYLTVVEDGG